MNARRVMSALLSPALLLAVASVWTAAPLSGNEPVKRGEASTAAADSRSDARNGIIVYYFHGSWRCNTCRTIEAYAKEAVEGKYGEQLRSGRLEWKVVNTDEPENEHFVEDFGLVSSSLVVVERHDDRTIRHTVLQDAWTLVRDKPRFIEYVQRSVGEYLKS
jgi:hypothetical protein